MNNSFTEQLNCIQSLQQITPPHTAKDHLLKDIISILEKLGRVDNTPFDKLYYLAESCTDCYYTSIIKTFVQIIKWSTTNRQTVIVNMARELKYLEDLGQRQSQLFMVLEKYHLLPDSLENLQSQFGYLKQATSKNIRHLQQAITVQQTYTVNLCTYIYNIFPCITKLEEAILQLEQKFIMQQDIIQINAPDFDLGIDGPNLPRIHNNAVVVSIQEYLTSPEPEVLDATNFKEEDTDRDPPDATYKSSDNFPQDIQNCATKQSQITSGYSTDPEEIPQLEEDWVNNQFADADANLINRHNTHSESERIRREYTQHLLDLSDNQYYYKENPMKQLQFYSPDSDYYGTLTRQLQKKPHDPNGYYPPPPDPADIQHWRACGGGKHTLLHGHRLFGEKTQSAESRKARKRRQNYRQ